MSHFWDKKIDTFNPKRPYEWVRGIHKLLKTNCLEWLEDTNIYQPGVTVEISKNMEKVITEVKEFALPAHVKARLGMGAMKLTINQLMTLVDDKYPEKSA